MVIENFSTLSREELNQFAKKLLDKINAESLITDEVDLQLPTDEDAIWANEMTGNLHIALDAVDISGAVGATWQSPVDEPYEFDDADEDGEPDFDGALNKEVVVDGYKVTVTVDDYEYLERLEVEVLDYSEEDSGIGSYEFWGSREYDSHPYLEVEGEFINLYSVVLTLTVEPAETSK